MRISLSKWIFSLVNMNIIILPLLIANQLTPINETDPYGQEIRYNVTYNGTTKPQFLPTSPSNQSDQMAVYRLENQLKCRLRTPKILNCRMTEPISTLSYFNSTSGTPMVSTTVDDGEQQLANLSFEMKFNRFGIKQLFVPSTISPFILDMIRSIANQFHTGIDLTDKTDGTYRAWENFTTGDCFTSYTVQLTTPTEESPRDIRLKKWQPAMTTALKKHRNLEKCRGSAPYFFGSRESWRDQPRFVLNLKSSDSSIIANTTHFTSFTETSLELDNAKPRPRGTIKMRETMLVKFDSIAPAEIELEKIADPASAGIVTGKWIHDDFSKEHINEDT